jgi:circadian clock protein KaiB
LTTKKTPKKKNKIYPAAQSSNGNYILHLFIAGQSIKAANALKNLRSICKEKLGCKYKIRVYDLLKFPKLGRLHQIVATPALMRKLPLPVKQIIGDLSNTDSVLIGLGLKSAF